MSPQRTRILVAAAALLAAALAAAYAWQRLQPSGPGEGFASGNGRIEATEIDVATKLAGRVQEIARMLGGVEITEITRQHASELLRRPA